VCILTSIIGTYFVRLGGSNNIMGAMYKGFLDHGRAVRPRHLVGHLAHALGAWKWSMARTSKAMAAIPAGAVLLHDDRPRRHRR
jgi:K(+)-stimulated pyrophosphate-energized sodium pump